MNNARLMILHITIHNKLVNYKPEPTAPASPKHCHRRNLDGGYWSRSSVREGTPGPMGLFRTRNETGQERRGGHGSVLGEAVKHLLVRNLHWYKCATWKFSLKVKALRWDLWMEATLVGKQVFGGGLLGLSSGQSNKQRSQRAVRNAHGWSPNGREFM